MSDRLAVTCPCCKAELTVERDSGEVLAAKEAKKDPVATFDAAMKEVQEGAGKREDAFSKAFERTQRMDDILSKKFEEAKKKAEEVGDDGERPRHPLDFD